jgi:hypothetical protein
MRRVLPSRLVFCLACFFLLATFSAFAQKITGDIEGNVTDSSGAVVPNVTISVQNTGTGLARTATTNNSGGYRLNELPVGTYKITATAQGFKTLITSAEVNTGAIVKADIALQIGQRTETVEVEGTAPLVELSSNNNNYVDNEKIEALPLNGRDFNSLLAITPGVQRAPGGGFLAVSINGARTTSNNYFIDGLYNNDRYYGDSAINQTGILGIPAVTFPPEAIEELSVQETPSAEFGVRGGAPILLSMKSGTNAWHGSGTWVNHNGIGDAANYFSKHNDDNCGSPGECKATPIHNNQFNGTIGGPIIKDKAFLFLFYEGQRYKSVALAGRTVPSTGDIALAEQDIANNGLQIDTVGQTLLNYFPVTSNGFFVQNTPTTASNNEFGVKVDYKLANNQSLTGRYIFGDSLQSGPPYAGLPAGGSNPSDMFNSFAPSRAQMAGVSWTWNFSNNKILESRLGFTRFSQLLGVNNKIDPKSLGVDTGPLGAADFGVPYVYLYHLGYGGYIGGVQGYPLSTQPDQTWDWSEHFSWVKGNHTIKLGGNFQRAYTNSIRNNARSGLTAGYFAYYAGYLTNPDGTQNGVASDIEELLLGKADFASRSFGDTHRHIVQNSVGFYAQDDWKIKPHLTVNYGLRYEINGTLRDTDNKEAIFDPARGFLRVGTDVGAIHNVDYHDFGPHAGFAWDVLGNGRMALRGGYSLSFDVANFGALASPYTFARARTGVFTQLNLGFVNQSNLADVGGGGGSLLPPAQTDYTLGSGCYDPAQQVGDYICFDTALAGTPLFGTDPTGTAPFNAFSIVPDFKTPRYHNFNLSLQDELFHNNVLTLTYSGQRGKDLLIYQDLNASPIGTACTNPSGCDPFRPLSNTFTNTDGSPLLRHVIEATNLGQSQYDSLQVSYNQRAWHGLNTQYNLTWSKCYDYNSVNRGGAGDYPQVNNSNPVGSTALGQANVRDSYGLCDHDVRLNFNAGGVYSFADIPHLGKYLGKGWQMSGIFTGISGRPFSAILGGGSERSGQGLIGNSIRASWDGTPVKYNTRNPDGYVVETYSDGTLTDPCGRNDPGTPITPFYAPCDGAVGNSRRNQLIGPGLAQWDMSLIKNTHIGERLNVEIRWEVFNILNRANFHYFPDNNILGNCSTLLGNGTCAASEHAFATFVKTSDVAAGNPVIAQGGPRNMNFSLKLTF